MERLTVVYGCMYSGKSSYLLDKVESFRADNKKILLCKPQIDTRYAKNKVVSHLGQSLSCSVVSDPYEILVFVKNERKKNEGASRVHGVAIDEVQFFSQDILTVIDELRALNIFVLAAGLDHDWKGHPFGVMPDLLKDASHLVELFSQCGVCQSQARWTHRLVDNTEGILLGSHGVYEPRCDEHFQHLNSTFVENNMPLLEKLSHSDKVV